MSRIAIAGAGYFAVVITAGFALGAVRVIWVVPIVGMRAAELLELPLMLAVMALAARALVRRLRLEPTVSARLGMGLIALALVVACELALVLRLRDMSMRSYFTDVDPVSAAAYYGALLIFAALPLFIAPSALARRTAQKEA